MMLICRAHADMHIVSEAVVHDCFQGYALKKICEYASNRGFTDVIVFNEDRKSINGMLLVHLPGGPTAHFKLSNLRLSKDIRVLLVILPLPPASLQLYSLH